MKRTHTIDDGDIKITVQAKDGDRLLANATVVFKTYDFGMVTLKNFQVWKSDRLNERLQEHINIAPPSVKYFGRYTKIFFVEDEKLWSKLESRIYDAYHLLRSKNDETKSEWVNPDDIPI